MLQMAELFKGKITLTELLGMPLRMVHILREVRIEQIEREKSDADRMKNQQASGQDGSFSGSNGVNLAAMEEFIGEHS